MSVRVVEAVAEAKGLSSVSELDACLYDVIEPDSLDRLFGPTDTGGFRGVGMVAFEVAGHEVIVESDGTILVEPLERARVLDRPEDGE